MRVIAGSARGTRLAPVPRGTRPLSDRAREGLFSSLADQIPGARVADLFAGTGATGIEALSRGAASALFVDSSAGAVRTIRANLDRTGLAAKADVVRADVARALERLEGPFDLAFLDPPYAHPPGDLADVLARLTPLVPGGTIVLTRPRGNATDVIPIHWQIVRLLDYGDTRVLICREGT
ncbi:MAG TPA: RsmD family RNA methyltransferase [Actinomycetota bacterium]|nr:RsmD family RNA methyltransferase [Actinomycetota bacterium]